MRQQLPEKEEILSLCTSQFAGLSPKRPLCLPGFKNGEYDRDFDDARRYVLALMQKKPDEVGSPIFHFVVKTDMGRLSAGSKKWVGVIPREITSKTSNDLVEKATDVLIQRETERLRLGSEEIQQVQSLIRNTLIASLHSGFKAAPKTEALNAALDGKENFISYKDFEEKLKNSIEVLEAREKENPQNELDKETLDAALITLFKELGVIEENAGTEEKDVVLQTIADAKDHAWLLYQSLGDRIQKAQLKADIKGPIAKVDLNGEHIPLHFIDHLRALYGRHKKYGQTISDRFELQTVANLTWLMARLETHPAIKRLKKHKDTVIKRFTDSVYNGRTSQLVRCDKKKTLYLDAQMRITSPEHASYIDEYEVYTSQIEGFDDLSNEVKEFYRGERLFRTKEELSICIKAMKGQQELGHVHDLLAGEAVMMGIDEKDLDPTISPQANRLKEFIIQQAKAIANATGLQEAPRIGHYSKIPVGTYKIEEKLGVEDPENNHSFNFPTIKIYFNFPVGDGENGLRTEYRLICRDTWLRGNKEVNSMSHHDNYKLKQAVDLLDILSARVYNGTIHPVATGFKLWCEGKEKEELTELRSVRKAAAHSA